MILLKKKKFRNQTRKKLSIKEVMSNKNKNLIKIT